MLITEKLGSLDSFPLQGRAVDYVVLHWFEASKRILHKQSAAGRDVQMKFLQGDPQFQPGDVIFVDANNVGVIDIAETEVIVARPENMQDMAAICYEIGNKHLPLFYQEGEILVAFDNTLFTFLQASGYKVEKTKSKLTHALKTTVVPHSSGVQSIFSRIMQRTTRPE